MAYREVEMWEILSVLERIGRGESKSAVARLTGLDRKTVRRYVALAEELGWKPGEVEPTEQLAQAVEERTSPAKNRRPGEVEAELMEHQAQIEAWLRPNGSEKRGLRLTKVQTLLARQGVVVSYSALYRFAVKRCGFRDRRRATVRMADPEPGEAAEMDFGRLGLIPHPPSGGRKTVWALIVTLPYSRHQYVHATHSQRVQDVITGLEEAWAFFEGVVERLVLDNLAPAVKKADAYEPIYQRTMEEYARYRGFVLDATLPASPKGKPRVERAVSYVRDNFFRGEEWRDLEHVRTEAPRWCLETAGLRTHGTTRKRPLSVFESEEKEKLRPLVGERFDPPQWAHCTVHPDHHIVFDKASYSAPTEYRGERVSVRADQKLVRIFYKGKQIKVHPRRPPGGRSTDHTDYPEERTAYTMRDPERMIRIAKDRGEETGRLMEALFEVPYPWSKLRQAQKLLRLGDKYGWPRVEAACRRALSYEITNVRRVEGILRQDIEQLDAFGEGNGDAPSQLPPARFRRSNGSFTHPAPGGDR